MLLLCDSASLVNYPINIIEHPEGKWTMVRHVITMLMLLMMVIIPQMGWGEEVAPIMAVTLDDLPWMGPMLSGDDVVKANRRILTTLKEHKVPATGFVVSDRMRKNPEVLDLWKVAGMQIGNHTSHHPHFDDLSTDAWVQEVAECNKYLEMRLGKPVKWFRYPFLQTGRSTEKRDAGLLALRKLGLNVAHVTVDTGEWALTRPYVEALQAGDSARAKEIGRAWVVHVLAAVHHYRTVARNRTGTDIPHVLLLHSNAVAADHLNELLSALEAEGTRFASLEKVLKDPVYAQEDDYAGPIGLSWLYRIKPRNDKAWVWDDGQLRAMQARFCGVKEEPKSAIDIDLTVRTLRPGVWIVVDEKPYPANSLLVEMRDSSLVLVHTPYTPEATRRLLTWMAARFGERRLVAVNGHFHPDAAGGNEALIKAGAEVWGSDHTVRLLVERQGKIRDMMVKSLKDDPAAAEKFRNLEIPPPNHVFQEASGTKLRFGNETVEIIYPGPAHSPDNVAVWFPHLKILFGGCAILAGDRVGNRSDADLARWPEAIRRLQTMGAELVVPGHGSRTDPDLLEHTLKVLRKEGETK